MEFIVNVYNWALTQSLWIQILLLMLAILIAILLLIIGFYIAMLILYLPPFLLGRYVGVLAIFLIVPTFIVLITDNGRSSPLSNDWWPLLIAVLATLKGYWDGLKERKEAKMKKKLIKVKKNPNQIKSQ